MAELADYLATNGSYEFDGVSYEDATDLIHSGILGLCGCGLPEENLQYILGGLELIAEKSPETVAPEDNAFDEWWVDYKKRTARHFGNDQAAYFFYYWAAKNGLTEHGGGVPGWLYGKGLELLAILREWKTTQETMTESEV